MPGTNPLLSVIVIGFRMAAQLANTLFTLGPRYQRNVAAPDYEVVVVENESDDCLSADAISALPANFRYFRRTETARSPVAAINFGFSQAAGEYIGLVIDGARLVSPRVIEYAALAWRMDPDSITTVPGYHVGSQQHHEIVDEAQAYAAEAALLDSIDWRGNGYLLFTIATLGGGNDAGVFQPFMESNCVFAARRHFARIGDADPRFALDGGGSINLHIFRALGMHPGTRLVLLPGEGSFHQYHGGVTTRLRRDRAEELAAHKRQLHGLWRNSFHSLRREPFLLGAVTPWAMPVLEFSAQRGIARHRRLQHTGQPLWQDDDDLAAGRHFNPTAASGGQIRKESTP
jgi:glycosyltransferase involved in cell wall biosynthesis